MTTNAASVDARRPESPAFLAVPPMNPSKFRPRPTKIPPNHSIPRNVVTATADAANFTTYD